MNAHEIEALLARVDATFPSSMLSELERRMRVAEWVDSAAARFGWDDVGRAAWRTWKDTRDRPPTPHQFAETCRWVMQQQLADTPRLPEPPPSDAERERVLAFARESRAAIKSLDDG